MNKLQLIMVCGLILAAGLSWQMASEAKLKNATAQNSAPAISNDVIPTLSVNEIN